MGTVRSWSANMRQLVALLATVASALAGPIHPAGRPVDAAQCATTHKYAFEAGRVYTYEYSHVSRVASATQEWSARVDAHFRSRCEMVLTVSHVKFEGAANSVLETELSKYAFGATFLDGVVPEIILDR